MNRTTTIHGFVAAPKKATSVFVLPPVFFIGNQFLEIFFVQLIGQMNDFTACLSLLLIELVVASRTQVQTIIFEVNVQTIDIGLGSRKTGLQALLRCQLVCLLFGFGGVALCLFDVLFLA